MIIFLDGEFLFWKFSKKARHKETGENRLLRHNYLDSEPLRSEYASEWDTPEICTLIWSNIHTPGFHSSSLDRFSSEKSSLLKQWKEQNNLKRESEVKLVLLRNPMGNIHLFISQCYELFLLSWLNHRGVTKVMLRIVVPFMLCMSSRDTSIKLGRVTIRDSKMCKNVMVAETISASDVSLFDMT